MSSICGSAGSRVCTAPHCTVLYLCVALCGMGMTKEKKENTSYLGIGRSHAFFYLVWPAWQAMREQLTLCYFGHGKVGLKWGFHDWEPMIGRNWMPFLKDITTPYPNGKGPLIPEFWILALAPPLLCIGTPSVLCLS
jgi:hypothetical protein